MNSATTVSPTKRLIGEAWRMLILIEQVSVLKITDGGSEQYVVTTTGLLLFEIISTL